MANWIIRRGLVSNFAIHLAEYYSPESRLTQCFKCQGYGHVAPVCRKAETCGYCAFQHNTKDCDAITAQVRQLWKETRSLEPRLQCPTSSQGQKYAGQMLGTDSVPATFRCDCRRRGRLQLDDCRIKETEAIASCNRPEASRTRSASSRADAKFSFTANPIVRECLPASS